MKIIIILLRILRIFPFGVGACLYFFQSILAFSKSVSMAILLFIVAAVMFAVFVGLRVLIHKLHTKKYGVQYPPLVKEWNM